MKFFGLTLTFLIACCSTSYSQVGLIGGFNVGRYSFMESPAHNYSSQFNQGWAIKMDEAGQIVYFAPSNHTFKINNKMNWDQWNHGLKFGLEFNRKEKLSYSAYFLGATNVSSGNRFDETAGREEKFKVKSKFGGLYGEVNYKLFKKVSINGTIGFERYKLCYSYESDTIHREMSPMGWRLNFLSGEMKPKSRNMNFTVGLGLGYAIFTNEKLSIDIISQYRWAINELSEVYRGLYYNAYMFNLNSWNNSIQIVYYL